MEVLLKLPEDIFEHAVKFVDPRHPIAKIMGDFMKDMQLIMNEFGKRYEHVYIRKIGTYFAMQERFLTSYLNDVHLKHKKPIMVDWVMCGYHEGVETVGLEECGVRYHFSRLGMIWN